MTVRAHSANPAVLRWAREKAGLSQAEVAQALSKPLDVIRAWETGEAAPTFRQLEVLATRTYRRPLAVFFFSEVPEEEDLAAVFRTLPASEFAEFEPDTRFALREALARQLALAELTQGLDLPSDLITDQLRPTPADAAEQVVAQVRELLGVPLSTQQAWRRPDDALKVWRSAVEDVGVYVFKRSFKQPEVSGFCLEHDRFPVIVINNSTAYTRQVFTLFHELAHLLYGVSGVTTLEQDYLGSLDPAARRLEVACNRFAAEFLVPAASFPWQLMEGRTVDEAAAEIAQIYQVSRHVILRRFLDGGHIPADVYRAKVSEWADEHFRDGGASSGGSYYANQGTYLSEGFVNAAFHQFHVGRIGVGQLADYLGMKARNVGKFEEFILRGA